MFEHKISKNKGKADNLRYFSFILKITSFTIRNTCSELKMHKFDKTFFSFLFSIKLLYWIEKKKCPKNIDRLFFSNSRIKLLSLSLYPSYISQELPKICHCSFAICSFFLTCITGKKNQQQFFKEYINIIEFHLYCILNWG